jgi:hypothetical protein
LASTYNFKKQFMSLVFRFLEEIRFFITNQGTKICKCDHWPEAIP